MFMVGPLERVQMIGPNPEGRVRLQLVQCIMETSKFGQSGIWTIFNPLFLEFKPSNVSV